MLPLLQVFLSSLFFILFWSSFSGSLSTLFIFFRLLHSQFLGILGLQLRDFCVCLRASLVFRFLWVPLLGPPSKKFGPLLLPLLVLPWHSLSGLSCSLGPLCWDLFDRIFRILLAQFWAYIYIWPHCCTWFGHHLFRACIGPLSLPVMAPLTKISWSFIWPALDPFLGLSSPLL